MKLVIIFGSGAVGKMSVGMELMKRTNLRLFHNHMMIEPVIEVFGRHNPKLVDKLRNVIFEEFLESDLKGMIFTYMWAFDYREDWDFIENVTRMFEDKNGEVYYIELVASQEVRLQRNQTENRLKHKPSKRDIEESSNRILNEDKRYRLVSYDGEIPYKNYMKIDNTLLSIEEVVDIIVDKFHFE